MAHGKAMRIAETNERREISLDNSGNPRLCDSCNSYASASCSYYRSEPGTYGNLLLFCLFTLCQVHAHFVNGKPFCSAHKKHAQ